MSLAERLLAGDPRALARGISLVEENAPGAVSLLQQVFPRTGGATVLGMTGAPGAGKSSLVDRLIATYRADGCRVGVIAVDPSSAFSGGAILGDRVRMQSHSADAGVFIRSMATRGHLGGLARATNDAIDLLDAAGYDPVIVETVGVGQDEIDVVRTADAVVVVLVPGMGDDIQAIKAGILEIADLFVINKADHDGADRLQAELEYMLSLVDHSERPRPAIHRTVAVRSTGVADLRQGIQRFIGALDAERRRQRRLERERGRLLELLGQGILERLQEQVLPPDALRELVRQIAERRIDPYSAARQALSRVEVR